MSLSLRKTSFPLREANWGSILTNGMQGIPASAITAAANMDMIETLAQNAPSCFLTPSTSTCSPTPATQANMAAYLAFLKPGDTILGMDLSPGGHLTHGSPVNFSGRLFNIVSYGVQRETGRIDYDAVAEKAREHRPKVIVAGPAPTPAPLTLPASVPLPMKLTPSWWSTWRISPVLWPLVCTRAPCLCPRHLNDHAQNPCAAPRRHDPLHRRHGQNAEQPDFPRHSGRPPDARGGGQGRGSGRGAASAFKAYQQQVMDNAATTAACLTGSRVRPRLRRHRQSPHAGRPDPQNITGKDAEIALDTAGITVSKNTVPFETRSPFVTSGVRLGAAALTTRGMKQDHMRHCGQVHCKGLENRNDTAALEKIRAEVEEFALQFPLFAH